MVSNSRVIYKCGIQNHSSTEIKALNELLTLLGKKIIKKKRQRNKSSNTKSNTEEPNIMLSTSPKVKWWVCIHWSIWINTEQKGDCTAKTKKFSEILVYTYYNRFSNHIYGKLHAVQLQIMTLQVTNRGRGSLPLGRTGMLHCCHLSLQVSVQEIPPFAWILAFTWCLALSNGEF